MYGKERFPNRYAQAIDATGLEVQTLRNYCSVSLRVPVERRHPRLSWTHHYAIASLKPDAQVAWLERAEQSGLNSTELHKAIRIARMIEQGRASDDPEGDRPSVWEVLPAATLRRYRVEVAFEIEAGNWRETERFVERTRQGPAPPQPPTPATIHASPARVSAIGIPVAWTRTPPSCR